MQGMTSPKPPEIVVIGGSNMDLHARAHEPVVMGSSMSGSAGISPGGVGRNVAENLARLGDSVALVSVVGDDPIGDEVISYTEDVGVDCTHVRRRADVRTGTYNAVLDSSGELVAAVADMAATDEFSPLVVEAARDLIKGARGVLVEANIPVRTAEMAIDLAVEFDVPVGFDPVSVTKARRARDLIRPDRELYLVTPNQAELAALTDLPTDTDTEIEKAVRSLHDRGVGVVWVRLGARGSVISYLDVYEEMPAVSADVLDVTGAGDAMLAAFTHEILRDVDLVEAARFGHAAAALTCGTHDTVRMDLSESLVRELA
ncbi:pseudouridine kinase [Nocardioides albertanoniae]|uniref:Pseudouridine kinase n=2 Tax=Nocardioides albertanoniae TaxID=1175486 RepID=A0A543A0Q7_9ACTN|nr:pseudouridine kinase [Nocardioides albertanoniae]